MRFFALFAAVAVCLVAGVVAAPTYVLYNSNTGEFSLSSSNQHLPAGTTACAWGSFSDEIAQVGWSFLDVHSNSTCDDKTQAYAAGYLEGALTQERIWQTIQNDGINQEPLEADVQQFLDQQNQWTQQMIANNPTDPFWYHLALLNAQAQGLYEGYVSAAPSNEVVSQDVFVQLTIGEEIGDIAGALNVSRWVPSSEENGHCSALVKLLPDYSELFISQDTWSSLTSMLRIYKLYDLPFSLNGQGVVPAVNISFSSYPGSLYSGDDFYMMSSGLVSMETTIGNDNTTLAQEYIVPQTVLEWARNMIANRLAANTSAWAAYFSRENSGTYNNEWLVLDYNKFTPGKAPKPGCLLILDQIPGFIQSADITSELVEKTYMPSYNVAYFPFIFNMSGEQAIVAEYGNWFTYNYTVRAEMFARDHSKVKDLATMQSLMRYNDYEHDPLSRCNCTPPYSGENAIACRSDLNPADGVYPFSALGHRNHAATDSKITSYSLFQNFESVAISGPTYDQQPVFVWSESPYANVTHLGHPDRFEFPWITVSWS